MNEQILQPNRIREARLFRELTQGDVAEAVGVTKQAVSQYETGVITPTTDIIMKLSEVLDFPLAYFSKSYHRELLTPIFFRKRKTSTKKNMIIFQTYIQWMTEIYIYIEKFITLPKLNLITFDKIGYTRSEISDIATKLRRYWGLGDGPISNLILLLENNGVLISKIHLDVNKVDACSVFFTSANTTNRPMIFLTSGTTSVRSRRDVAHELGHQVLHSWMDKEAFEKNQDIIEKEADIFASYFLMPEAAMKREAYAVKSTDALLLMKQRWGASAQSILYHLIDIGCITDELAEKLKNSIYRRGWRTREPGDENLQQEKPELIKDAIMMLVNEKVKTPMDILDDLSMPALDVTELCGLSKLFFQQNTNMRPVLKLIK